MTPRVAVDGDASHKNTHVRRVPYLPRVMFLPYINDSKEDIFSYVELFANDSLLFRTIENIADKLTLQNDLG